MTKLPRKLLAVGLVCTLLLSACNNVENTPNPKNNSKPSNQTSKSLSATYTQQCLSQSPDYDSEWLIDPTKEFEDIMKADFKPAVAIDFEQYKKSFFDDEIITKINETLKAIVGIQLAEKSSDNSISNTMIMFTFTKNKEGQWGIANID